MTKNNEIVAISLFSGCGGLDIGCHLAGIPVLASLDFDKDAIETLKLNKEFENTQIFLNDITCFPSENFLSILKKHKKSKFIVIGGPPCQPFSKAGYWIGNDQRKGEEDPRNMLGEYLRVISDLKPHGFIFENVESLTHPTNKKTLETLLLNFSQLGYKYKLIKAYAPDYGVPQKRKRIFIIGSQKEFIKDEPLKTHCDPKDSRKLNLKPYTGVGEFIKKYDTDNYAEKEEITINGTYGKDLLEVPPGKNYIALTANANYSNPKFIAGKRFWSFLLKLDPDLPSWTIAAQPGPWVGPFHWTSRRLRVPEIAAIQTFPEEYKFYGSRRSIQRQIGNAVPPLLGKAMIEFLKENLES